MIYATYAADSGDNDSSGKYSIPCTSLTKQLTNPATLLISGSNFKLYNMNITNDAGTASQAVALSARGINQGFYASALKGWQDTEYSHIGSQFFGRCYIEGAVDFIFGITGQSWYQGCTLGVRRGAGMVTAQGRTSAGDTGYFVFDQAYVHPSL